MACQPQINIRSSIRPVWAAQCALALACLGAVPAGMAGQVGVRASTGVTGLADTPIPTYSGATWQDGVVSPISAPAGLYGYSVDLSAASSGAANLLQDVSVPPAPQQAAVPLPGWASGAADLAAGRLGVAAATSSILVTAPSGDVNSAFTVARVSAEMGGGLDVIMPWSGGEIPTLPVTLRLTLNGTISDQVNDASVGLYTTLSLSNVATEPGAPVPGSLEAVNTFSTSLSGQTISLTGNLLAPTCSTTYSVCAWFLGVHASIEGAGQFKIWGPSIYEGVAAGDALDFTDGAQVELLEPTGAKVTDGINGRTYGWVTSVPEPASAMLMLFGLLGLGAVSRARRACPCL